MDKEQIVYKKVSDLKLNPKNPRKNDDAVEVVAKSIEKYGFKNPLIIDADNVVWCGNTRLKASKQLGLKEVPCIVASDLTQEQIRELALIDNKSSEIAEWDFDLVNLEKQKELEKEIKNSNISKEQKEFLLKASQRHLVFDYSKIAEYYAHQDKEMQELMEKSALVIIDFGDAIKNGFVEIRKEIEEIYNQEVDDYDE